jgi:hypothetical protein
MRTTILVATAMLTLSGCATASQPGGTTALVDGDVVRPAVANQLTAEFLATSTAEQEMRVGELSTTVERQGWQLSGLDDALGGTAAADNIFAALGDEVRAKIATRTPDVQRPKITSALVNLPQDALSEAKGAGLFGGLMIGAVAADSAAGLVDGTSTGKDSADGVTRSVTATTGTIGVRQSTTIKGVELIIEAKTEVQGCPDANGQVAATAYVSSSANSAGTGSRSAVEVTVNVTVGEDAEVASTNDQVRFEQSEFAPGGRSFIDVTVTADGSGKVNRSVGTMSDAAIQDAATFALITKALLVDRMVSAAKKKWTSGACVKLATEVSAGPTGLKPSASVSIVAMPRSKVDGSVTGGTVTATLTAGGASVSPSATKVRADATFTYLAPDQPDKTGRVELESRSRRGVGKAAIDFDTYANSYRAVGGGGDWSASGTICDLRQPFKIKGMGLTMVLTPTSSTAGTYELSGTAGAAVWHGTGTYTVSISAQGNTGTLVTNGVNTVTSPVGRASDTATASFKLSRIAACGG